MQTSDRPPPRSLLSRRQPSAAEAVVQDRPTLGSLPRASRGARLVAAAGASTFVSSSVALAAVAVAQRRRRLPRPARRAAAVWSSSTACSASTAPSPPRAASSEDGAGWPVIRLVVAALFAWSASLLTPLDGGAQLALWVGFVVLDIAGRDWSAPLPAAASTASSAGSWSATRRPPSACAPTRRCATTPASSAPSRPPRTAPTRRGRVAALEVVDRYHADRVVIATPARRRRGPARPGPLLQVDRRPGQPAAAPARPARGAGRDPEPGRRRAADRGRGARRPRRRPLHRPRPPRHPQDQGQRRRPGDERGEEHRPRARASCPRACTR